MLSLVLFSLQNVNAVIHIFSLLSIIFFLLRYVRLLLRYSVILLCVSWKIPVTCFVFIPRDVLEFLVDSWTRGLMDSSHLCQESRVPLSAGRAACVVDWTRLVLGSLDGCIFPNSRQEMVRPLPSPLQW